MTTNDDDARRRLHRALGIMLDTAPKAAQRIKAFGVWRTFNRDRARYPEAYDARRKGNALRKQRRSLGQAAALARQQGNAERAEDLDRARDLLARTKATVKGDHADLTSARHIELLGIRELLKIFQNAADEAAITVRELGCWLDETSLPPARRWPARCWASVHRFRSLLPDPREGLDEISVASGHFDPPPAAKVGEQSELLRGFREDLLEAMGVPAVASVGPRSPVETSDSPTAADAPTQPAAVAMVSLDDRTLLGFAALCRVFGVRDEHRSALRGRLKRLRQSDHRCYTETEPSERGARDEMYLYRAGHVRPVVDDLKHRGLRGPGRPGRRQATDRGATPIETKPRRNVR